MISCIFIFHIIPPIITNASSALLKILHFVLEVISLHDISLSYPEQMRGLKSELKIEYQHHPFSILKHLYSVQQYGKPFQYFYHSVYIINHSRYDEGFLFVPKYIFFREFFHSYKKSILILIFFFYHFVTFVKFLKSVNVFDNLKSISIIIFFKFQDSCFIKFSLLQ